MMERRIAYGGLPCTERPDVIGTQARVLARLNRVVAVWR